MSGDAFHAIHDLSSWEQRVQSIRKSVVRAQTMRDTIATDLSRKQAETAKLANFVERVAKAGELLRLLMDKLVLDQVRSIESVVSEGLRSIFFDQDLSFEAEVGQSRNKISIDLMVRSGLDGISIVGPPLETVGGGVSSIASLTLRLLALMRLKKFPLLLLDETLSAVSDEYVDATGQFLAKLAAKTGIPILLVTHKQAFLDHAKGAYQGFQDSDPGGGKLLTLKNLRDNV